MALARATFDPPRLQKGWRSESSTGRWNSGQLVEGQDAQMRQTDLAGRTFNPPPVSAAMLAEWCGARNRAGAG